MRPDLLGNIVGRRLPQPPHANGLVGTAGKDGRPIRREASVQDRRLVVVIDLRLGLGLYGLAGIGGVGLDLPDANARVPIRRNQKVGGRGPIQRGDSVGSGLWDVAVLGSDGFGLAGGGCRRSKSGHDGFVV